MKHTAVEWLIEELQKADWIPKDSLIMEYVVNQAKEMEKQQMFEYIKNNYCIGHKSLEFHRLQFEQYYNDTFKK
jgi:hypothetical protein